MEVRKLCDLSGNNIAVKSGACASSSWINHEIELILSEQ